MVFGNEEQKRRFLPPLIAGKDKACFAVTEPDAGLDTTRLKTFAQRDGDDYVLNGRKIWISTAQVANKMLILARTTALEKVAKPTQGLSLFYTDLDRERVEVREIGKMGRAAVDSNMLFIDNLRVPVADRIGKEELGFPMHPAWPQPRAHPDCCGGGGAGSRRAGAGDAVCEGARGFRPAHRPKSKGSSIRSLRPGCSSKRRTS